MRNLEEGIKVQHLFYCTSSFLLAFQFYGNLADIFTQFKEICKVWSNERKQEIQYAVVLAVLDRESHSLFL
jgi:hypothetical protein